MSDYDDDDYDDDDDWLYIEDHYDEADNLAEHTCPSPALQETLEYNEYDPYDYWEDLTYLSDGVYELARRKPKEVKRPEEDTVTGKKRKRTAMNKVERGMKRVRVGNANATPSRKQSRKGGNHHSAESSTVIWRTEKERGDISLGIPSQYKTTDEAIPVAILKDWKERFRDDTGLQSQLATVEEEDDILTTPTSHEMEVTGDGFDLNNIQAVAELLSGDSLDTIKNILKAQGLDPDAVEAVLQDLITGKEPDPDLDDGDEDQDQDQENGEEVQDEDSTSETSDHTQDSAHGKDLPHTSPHPRVQLIEHSDPADREKEHDLATTLHATNTHPKENGTTVVKTKNGGDTELAGFRAVRHLEPSVSNPTPKRRKLK